MTQAAVIHARVSSAGQKDGGPQGNTIGVSCLPLGALQAAVDALTFLASLPTLAPVSRMGPKSSRSSEARHA